jgi:hypothetical protein
VAVQIFLRFQGKKLGNKNTGFALATGQKRRNQENSLYLIVIVSEYENRPQVYS